MLINEEKVIPKLAKEDDINSVESNVWYLDNGASNHMTGSKSKFDRLDEQVQGRVKFGDGSMVQIEGKGSIVLQCKNGESRTLENVYYIPSLRSNIVSLGQLSEEGHKVVMCGVFLWIRDNQGKLLMKVKRSANRLYKVLLYTMESKCMLTRYENDNWLWHYRLGHVNFKALQLMSRMNMAHGLPNIDQPKENCSGCLMAKQTRKGFPQNTEFHAKKPLELVHGDLCGPISPCTPAGNRYILLLVDDYSRVMWIYLLKNKNDAFDAFKKFRALVEKGPDKKIETFRTDRGGEFLSKEFLQYCEEAGISRQFTAPYSPQQNGVVERRNRTMIEMARSLLKEMEMPLYLWGEAVRHSIYLLNRLPTRAVSGMTPYEAWSGKKPHLEHIRVFGCLAYMKLPTVNLKKLDDSSKAVVHLGKEPGTKAYRLFDPETNKISVSRDVLFEERRVWNWSQFSTPRASRLENFVVFTGGMHEHEQTETIEDESGNTYTPSSATRSNQSTNNEYTPQSSQRSSASVSSNTSSDEDSQPRPLRFLEDIYNETEPVELAEDELMLMGIDEPVNYSQAAKEGEWRKAMRVEIDAVERNNTWVLTELPTGRKAIDLKWIYKIKRDADGQIIKYKARIVAKGYVQKQGVDFEEVFAPVTRIETIRLLLALAAKNSWEVHHLDVKTAFLNGEIAEEVYVSQPEGFVKRGKERLVYKLLKALYGLRQAPRAWYSKLNRSLEDMGFVRCPYEQAVYSKKSGEEVLIIAVYVDDLLVTGSSLQVIEDFKKQMGCKFDMSDLGKLSYYLGIEVEQGKGYIQLKQSGYARKVLEKAGMSDCNSTKFPMDPKEVIHKDEKGVQVNATEFKSLIGGLRYLVHTRPDLAYSVGIVSRFMERPTVMHQNAAKRILRYVKGTIDLGLVYTKDSQNNMITGYSDSDLAGNVEDRKSTGGMVFYLNDSLVTWVSQKQRCVALSSCEAEFMAATAAACQAIWLRKLLTQITGRIIGPVTLFIDNKSALDLAKNPVFHGRSKHIDIRYHFIRECVEKGEIIVKHVRTDEQRADLLTKALSTVKFERMRKLLGVKTSVQATSN